MNGKMVLAGLVALLLATSPARAQVILTVQDATISQGQSGYIDIYIRSASTDLLSLFGFEFRITTGSPNRLEFTTPQPDPQLTDSNYVLFNDSLDQINAFAVGAVSTMNVPNDTFIGGDQTNSFTDVTLTNSSRLLARLQVTANTVLPPVVGDTFTISLIEGNGSPGAYTTFFQDSSFNDLTLDHGGSKLTGTITIQSIPEPGPLLLGAVALLLGGATLRRGHHRSRPC